MAQQKYTQAQQVIDTLRKTGGYATNTWGIVLSRRYKIVGDLYSQQINPKDCAAI